MNAVKLALILTNRQIYKYKYYTGAFVVNPNKNFFFSLLHEMQNCFLQTTVILATLWDCT